MVTRIPVGQTRRQSIFETCTTYAVGYTSSVALQVLIFPLFGVHLQLQQNAAMGAIFYGIALIRAYVFRRLFNRIANGQRQTRLHSGVESFINNAIGYSTTVILLLTPDTVRDF